MLLFSSGKKIKNCINDYVINQTELKNFSNKMSFLIIN